MNVMEIQSVWCGLLELYEEVPSPGRSRARAQLDAGDFLRGRKKPAEAGWGQARRVWGGGSTRVAATLAIYLKALVRAAVMTLAAFAGSFEIAPGGLQCCLLWRTGG